MANVVFIHLDLGIGGAESLVLNLAKATLNNSDGEQQLQADAKNNLQPSSSNNTNSISIYTTHCSPTHCYDEVKPPNGTLSSYVHVCGSWLPRNIPILGGTALCSAIRMLYLTYKAMKENPQANVFVLDVLPTGVPYLVEYCNVNAGVLFYCHFPDKLLTRDTVNGEADTNEDTNNSSIVQILKHLKQIYRWIMDTIEEWSMSYSDLIVVNSKFTRMEVEKTFPSLFLPRNTNNHNATNSDASNISMYGERVKVLYPSIESSLSKQRKISGGNSDQNITNAQNKESLGPIVSLNRFERKKNVALLLHAYDLLLEQYTKDGDALSINNLPQLIIAGGYDPLNVENVEHLAELRTLADQILDKNNLPKSTVCSPSKFVNDDTILEGTEKASIVFHPSISNTKRTQLLSCASVWCYTPHREHFGIVPLEAMDAGVPVVAIRSGGPMETIVDGVTGYLVDYSSVNSDTRDNPTVKGFADAIHNLLGNPSQSKLMGQRGRERVDKEFGMETFRKQWWELITEAQKRGMERHHKGCTSYPSLGWSVLRIFGELSWIVPFAMAVASVLRKFGLWT